MIKDKQTKRTTTEKKKRKKKKKKMSLKMDWTKEEE